MTYPQWWERLVAAIIDGIILAIVTYILTTILVAIAGTSISMIRVMLIVSTLLNTAIIVAYKVFFESGGMQATPGKLVFGLKVADANGNRAPRNQVLMRTWPWWLNLLTIIGALALSLGTVLSLVVALILIGIFFTFFMDPVGRCLHDQTANLHVVKAGKGMVGGGT